LRDWQFKMGATDEFPIGSASDDAARLGSDTPIPFTRRNGALLQTPSSLRILTVLSVCAITASIALQDVGGAIAKSLFGRAGSDAMITLRFSMAALILLAIQRPWRTPIDRKDWPALAAYGLMLGAIGLLLYRSFALLPIGVTVGIQATGPLAVAISSSRRQRDLLWIVLACTGLCMLLLRGGTCITA
jgi:inner membrane transporter RhtA